MLSVLSVAMDSSVAVAAVSSCILARSLAARTRFLELASRFLATATSRSAATSTRHRRVSSCAALRRLSGVAFESRMMFASSRLAVPSSPNSTNSFAACMRRKSLGAK